MPALPATDMSPKAQIIHIVGVRPGLLPGPVGQHHTEQLKIGSADLHSGLGHAVTARGEGAVSTCLDHDAVDRRAGDVKHGALEADGSECWPTGCKIISGFQCLNNGAGLQRVCSNHDPPADTVGRDMMRIIGGDDASPEPFVCQLVDGGDAATSAGVKGRRVIVGFDGMRTGLCKAERLFCGNHIPFGLRDADKGACGNSAADKFRASFGRACYGKIQGQPFGQNVPEPRLVKELAVTMKLGRDDGDEIVAVQPRSVTDGLGGKARVGLVMVRQPGESIPCFAIDPYHVGDLVPAIRMGAVAVKIATEDLAVRAEQVSGHDVGIP